MKILVLQHLELEHPGVFRKYLNEDGHEMHTVQLHRGEEPPPLDGFDALWVMGGPMDVWQVGEYPWLAAEKELIRNGVAERGLPFLGLCLGHQLLAEALGGRCGKAMEPEIGIFDVQLTEEGATGVLFDGLPERFETLQWHGAEVQVMPAGAACLATSPACAVQAMRWGTRAYSMQFHTEIEGDTVANWNADPVYAASLKSALGDNGASLLEDACATRIKAFNNTAERIYINWLQAAANC